jgi:hypothetical protein
MILKSRSGSTLVLNGMQAVDVPIATSVSSSDFYDEITVYPSTVMFVDAEEIDLDTFEIHAVLDGKDDADFIVDLETFEGLRFETDSSEDCPNCGYRELHTISYPDAPVTTTACWVEGCDYTTEPE